jgi:small-conductance mechanosensitive channel
LILLAERPIKPGDWVIVGGHEGTVKKVNVRSTEIETFQRASVIIPNADLISTPVTNWTHKNILGRVEVLVGVAYGSDPHQVKAILLECAKAHPNVTAQPEPYVIFADFADSSLNFELRAYLANVEKRLHTGSDLRFAIHDAFKADGVEIPFPQRVVHFPPGTFPGAVGAEEPKVAPTEDPTETPVEVSSQSGPQDQPQGDPEATLETPSEPS